MKKTRYTEEQIAFSLKQAETGTRVEEVCRKMGISEATFYNWKKKFGGMGMTERRRLRQLEEENHRRYELTFSLNHLAYFQLTTSLMPLITATRDARVVSTASAMQAHGRFDPLKTPTSLNGSGPRAYATSKLCNILFTKALQERLSGTSAVANCFEPGMVRTQFGGMGSTDQGFLLNMVYALAKPFAISPEKGAESLIWLATSPEAFSLKGQYVSKCRPVTPQKQAVDAKLAEQLWNLSEELCAKALHS